MSAIVRASYPVSFQLLNRDRQPILGIFDGQQGQTLKLEITNSSRRNMKPKQLAGNPTADNHHFELRFRRGTIVLPDSASPARPAISVEEPGWKISDRPAVSDAGVSFYLLITNPTTIESGKSTSVTLTNLSGDGKVGAQGTRVELKWNNSLEYVASAAGQLPEPLVPGHRLQHLSLVNQSGQKHIPLHIGIVGNDKVLNNGKENQLKLRITSLVKPDPSKPGEGNIQLNSGPDPKDPPATKFIFSFDAAGQDKPWALGTIDQVNKIGISAGTKFNTPTATEQGQSVQWIMWPTDAITLRPGDSIDFNISKIVTEHPSGLTNLYIHYKNIPGYWDGNFVALIEKAPVIYKDQLVGVGTNDPKERLHVAGKLRVDNDVSVGEKVTVDKLRVEKDVSVGGTGVFTVDAPNDPGGRLRIDTESKVSVKKLRVEKDVSVGGAGAFEIDAENVQAGRLKIDTDGKVGIGTAPEKHLHVAGTGDQEIMIQSKDAGGVKWSLQSSGSSGRFEIFNRTADENRFTILKDGNVGIGTTNPGGFINTANYFKADKDGRILEVHSPTRESVLILSTSQDANTAHLVGLYFTRTGGQADAHREVAAIKCRQVNAGKFAGGHLHFFTKVGDDGIGPNSPRMVITDNGKVGIGTTTPAAPLHVIGGQANSFTLARWMDNLNLGANGGQRSDLKHSIIADERIRAAAFDTVSDARVKTVLGTSGGASDLDALLKIIITDYTYKDVIGKGNGTYKKVIGQQIEKVFPQAVTRVTDVVPDIYQRASIQDGWIALATDLKKGDRVKLIAESGREDIHEVLEVTGDKFRVDLEPEGEKIFVYGREVDDFITVDYDAIAMLNVSATQQIKKEMDQELKALRVENAELRAANDALAKRLQLLESRLETVVGVMAAANGSNGNGRH